MLHYIDSHFKTTECGSASQQNRQTHRSLKLAIRFRVQPEDRLTVVITSPDKSAN